MSEHNPYASPEADVALPLSNGRVAGRWRRLGGSLIDTTILMLVILPVMYFGGGLEYVSFAENVFWQCVGFAVFLVLNGWLLVRQGQTIGKLALGMRTVDAIGGRVPGFSRIALLRFGLPYALMIVPIGGMIFAFVDCLMIFGSERRCVHDYMAGTRVVLVD